MPAWSSAGSTTARRRAAFGKGGIPPEAGVGLGRLYYCPSGGGFEQVEIPLDAEARTAAAQVAETVGGAIEEGFLPAAPAQGACTYCEYRPVCGPYEETRMAKKSPER